MSAPKPKKKPRRPEFKGCDVCGAFPIVVESGLCGPCTFGTADAIGEGEYIEEDDE